MQKGQKALIWIAGIIIVLVVIFAAAYVLVEKKIFSMLSEQPGVKIEFSAKTGNLFTGYTISDLTLKQTQSHNDVPPTVFTTPRLTVHWKLNPAGLTEISWDEGNLAISLDNGGSEDIMIGGGSLLPGEPGWLESESDIDIGQIAWGGALSVKIRQKVEEVKAVVNFNNFPSRLISLLGEQPRGFILPEMVIVEMELDGPPSNLEAHGTVSDPLTRRSYRF
jgi:hypothetical protein